MMFTEAVGIQMYGDVSQSFKDFGHADPLAWNSHDELSPLNRALSYIVRGWS